MDYKFNSNKNKELLWDLLYNQNFFKDIPNNLNENVMKLFEEELSYIETKTKGNGDLLILNKMFIQNFTQKLVDLKKNSNVTMFHNILDKKQEEFNELINVKKPETIDFEDNQDRPLLQEDLNKRLEELQNMRVINNNELESTEIKLSQKENNKEKRVNFKEEIIENIKDIINEEDNFLKKLKIKEEINKKQLDNYNNKPIPDNNKEILIKLDIIIERLDRLESNLMKK